MTPPPLLNASNKTSSSISSSSTSSQTPMFRCLSAQQSATLCAIIQALLTASISTILSKFFVNERQQFIVDGLIITNSMSTFVAICFAVVLVCSRHRLSTWHNPILHAYLLSVLFMGMVSLFSVLYFPMTLIRNMANCTTIDAIKSICITGCYLIAIMFQLFQRNIVESLVPYTEF